MAKALNKQTGLLDVEQSLLLMVDMQERLLAAMQPAAAQSMLDNVVKLLKAADFLMVPVLLTEQYPKGLGPTAEVLKNTLPETAQCFEKTAFSCCGNVEFNRALQASGKNQVIIVGQEAHVCVLQTAFDLHQQGCEVFIVEDAVCSRTEQHKNNALQRMRQFGTSIACHESVLFEWLRDAQHPYFKVISALVR